MLLLAIVAGFLLIPVMLLFWPLGWIVVRFDIFGLGDLVRDTTPMYKHLQ